VSEEMDLLRKEMNEQMTALRSEVKEVSKVLLELVRLDGVIKNQYGLINRISTQVDDHERRIRIGEVENSVHQSRLGTSERVIWLIVSSVFAAAFFFLRT
jgi:hypothetical protein